MMDLRQAITVAWHRVRERVETIGDLDFNHEFTLQFHLAWEIARVLEFSDRLQVRFEVPCGDDENGECIRLDLLMWIDPAEKFAIELKAPVKSNGKNSAMTQFRMRFYRDIARLRHLVEMNVDGIVTGCFVAVVNEPGYVRENRQRVNAVYRTYHGTHVEPGSVIPSQAGPNGYRFPMRMPAHAFSWSWQLGGLANAERPHGKPLHHWLEPIFVERYATGPIATDRHLPKSWLKRRLLPGESEYSAARNLLGPHMRDGDELWFYDEPAPPGVNAGELGYALVRSGEPIHWLTTAIH